MTEHNNPAEATEIERLTKLADANGQQARFWADHFAEIERANRDALGAHHKPGRSVAELITTLVGDLADARRMRDLLAEEADELREAGHRVAGMFNSDPENHQISGALHNIVGQLIAWRTDPAQVPDGWQSLVRKGWSVGARPAIPVDAEEGTFGQRCEELGRIPAGRYYLTSGVEVGDNREVVSRFDIPGGVRIAGFWPSHKARIEPAPVSEPDTATEDGEDDWGKDRLLQGPASSSGRDGGDRG